MSQRPPAGMYSVLDTGGNLTPLHQLLRCISMPGQSAGVLVVSHKDSGELTSVVLDRISEVDHDRTTGAVVFNGELDDGRNVQGTIYAEPKTEGSEVLGTIQIYEEH